MTESLETALLNGFSILTHPLSTLMQKEKRTGTGGNTDRPKKTKCWNCGELGHIRRIVQIPKNLRDRLIHRLAWKKILSVAGSGMYVRGDLAGVEVELLDETGLISLCSVCLATWCREKFESRESTDRHDHWNSTYTGNLA